MFYGKEVLRYRNPNLDDQIEGIPERTFEMYGFTPRTIDTGDGTATLKIGEATILPTPAGLDGLWEGMVEEGVSLFLQEAYRVAVEQAAKRGSTVVEIMTNGYPRFDTYQPWIPALRGQMGNVYGSIFADVVVHYIPQSEGNIRGEK